MPKQSKKSFRELEAELQRIMERVESSDYEELDELLKDYQAGLSLIEQLETRLNEAENEVKKMSE